MNLDVLNGKYVVAVSGGVDSVVLLDLLYHQSLTGNLQLIVAHFDHGIRDDSAKDLKLVKRLAAQYKLTVYFKQGHLGQHASEQLARQVRYQFLWGVVKQLSADGLITAHHQDDLIETAILNIIRGTGRKGLTSMNSATIIRPLLNTPKSAIVKYAKEHHMSWHEDSTNTDLRYLRNYIRHKIMPRLSTSDRSYILEIINNQTVINQEIDDQLSKLMSSKVIDNILPRLWLNSLDNSLSKEVLATWLRQNNIRDFDRLTLERLNIQLKTLNSGKVIDVINNWRVQASANNLALEHIER